MLDTLIILASIALGLWVVPALLWRSYGPWFERQIAGAADALRGLKVLTPWGRPTPPRRPRYDDAESASPLVRRERTNERTNEPHPVAVRSLLDDTATALQLDRTREAVIRTLVAAGWNVSEIRSVVKGAAAELGQEIAAARETIAAGELPPASLPADDPAAWESPAPGRLVRR